MPRFRRQSPETKIRDSLRDYLGGRGWLVEIMHGNIFQKGIPDLYLHHPKHGYRWVDVKVEGKYEFTKAQIKKWPQWEAKGVGIWILTEPVSQYERLFSKPNWRYYWKPKYDKRITIDEAIDRIE